MLHLHMSLRLISVCIANASANMDTVMTHQKHKQLPAEVQVQIQDVTGRAFRR